VSKLFEPLTLRGVTLPNRIAVSPMCQYSSRDGMPNEWHQVHLGSRAVGGAGLICVEATAVVAEGRISAEDMGLWNDQQRDALKPIVQFMRSHGSVPAIQLAHAGRKASTHSPFSGKHGENKENGWETVAPSALGFSESYPQPRALQVDELDGLVHAFVAAARRSYEAGFQVIELHMAHGYLLHEFLSPLSNQRTDDFGGSLENRMRFPLMVAEAVRAAWPDELPLFARISGTDWRDDGWTPADSVEFSRRLKSAGVDLVDCSSGGIVPGLQIPVGPGYQVFLAEHVRREAGVPTGAVGMITEPHQAEEILQKDQADLILLARAMLREPYWARRAASELGAGLPWPKQYERAG
jgi:2,4-dienoyl-CoA reductase-like NADH-dependent reductase (Old Yellow Enzyme family)